MTDTVIVEGGGTVLIEELPTETVTLRGDAIEITERDTRSVEVPVATSTVVAHEPQVSTLDVIAAGPQGPQGDQGDQGVKGDPGTLTYFTFNQTTPATVWTITHNLGGFFAVTVVDSAGTVVEGAITYQDANTVILGFSAPFSGTAYLS